METTETTTEHFHASHNPFSTPPFATPVGSIRSRRLDSAVGEPPGNFLRNMMFSEFANHGNSARGSSSPTLQKFSTDRGIREAVAGG
jgi:hypothetical protein